MSEWLKEVDTDEEELDEEQYENTRDAVLFCIQSSASLVSAKDEDGNGKQPALLSIFKELLAFCKRKVTTSAKDKVGVLLFDTEERVDIGGDGWDHIYLLQDLEQVGVEFIQKLKLLIEESEKDPQFLSHRFRPQSEEKSQLPSAFSACNSMYRSRASNYNSTRIFLITDNDDPLRHEGGAQLQAAAKTRANDLQEMGFKIIPFFISPPDQQFDISKFYADLLESHVDFESADQFFLLSSTDELFSELKAQLKIRTSPKRTAFTIPFVLAKGLEISIQGYTLINETKKVAAVQVDTSAREIAEVKQVTEYGDAQGRPLDVKHIKPYFPVGQKASKQEKVVFEKDDITTLKTLGMKPSLRLLGFVNPDRFPIEHQVKHSYFVYPTEKVWTGSTRTFAALLQVMLEKGKAGLGLLLPRRNTAPVHVLVMPQEETFDKQGTQLNAPGMNLIQLCFADDLRSLDIKATQNCPYDYEEESLSNKAIDTMKKIMGKLKQTYDPDVYPNPELNHHYEALTAIALKEALPEVVDQTLPLYHEIKKRAGDLMNSFKVDMETVAEDHPGVANALKVADKAAAPKRKRASADSEDDPENQEEYIVGRFQSQTQTKLLNDELKNYLRQNNCKLSGKKADLIERVRENLQAKGLLGEGLFG